MSNSKFPKTAFLVIGNEACERFSFYGMRSILTLYIVTQIFGASDPASPEYKSASDFATQICHLFNMSVYFMPLLGAWIADKFWGRYWTIIVMSLFYVGGNVVLASTVGESWGLAAGLGLIAFGSGGIKPCVSSFMGDQFTGEQKKYLERAFGMFYWAINFGSFFAFILIPPIKDAVGYAWAFAVPGIFMGLATLIFASGTHFYKRALGEWMAMPMKKVCGNILTSAALYGAFPGAVFATLIELVEREEIAAICPLAGTNPAGFVAAATSIAFASVGVIFSIATFFARGLCAFAKSEISEDSELFECSECSEISKNSEKSAVPAASLRERFSAIKQILLLFAITPIFWALFDQQSSTWILLGEKMTATSWLGFPLNAETVQGFNPVVVMLFVPAAAFLLYPALNKTKLFKATPLRRMSVGMFLAAASFVICGLLQNVVDAGTQISVVWMIVPVVVLTAGEVLFSATGLEFAYSQAPSFMRSTITSIWQLTTAIGNFLVVIVVALASDFSASERFYFFAAAMAAVAVLFTIATLFYKYKEA